MESIFDPFTSIVKIICHTRIIDPFRPDIDGTDSESIGTGFFINDKGLLLTNAHVIADAIKIWITVPYSGKDKIPVTVRTICFNRDIAVLHASGYSNKSYCTFGNSDKIKSNDPVTAIGYPLGLDKLKFNRGVISGRQYRYLQTDAPINSGNSGGPLLDKDNLVIGINTSKIPARVASNIGYATPIIEYISLRGDMEANTSDTVQIIIEPKLYAECNDTDNNLLTIFGCPTSGWIINNLYPDSPLYVAGLRTGDIITKFDDLDVDNYGECMLPWLGEKVNIFDLMGRYNNSSQIKISYWSARQNMIDKKDISRSAIIKFVPQTNPFGIRSHHPPYEKLDYEVFSGVVCMNLTLNHVIAMYKNENIPQHNVNLLAKYEEQENRVEPCVIVAHILGGSYISSLDILESGDIVDKLNNKSIKTLSDLRAVLAHPIRDKFILLQTKRKVIVALAKE